MIFTEKVCLHGHKKFHPELWDGKAAERIVNILIAKLTGDRN